MQNIIRMWGCVKRLSVSIALKIDNAGSKFCQSGKLFPNYDTLFCSSCIAKYKVQNRIPQKNVFSSLKLEFNNFSFLEILLETFYAILNIQFVLLWKVHDWAQLWVTDAEESHYVKEKSDKKEMKANIGPAPCKFCLVPVKNGKVILLKSC